MKRRTILRTGVILLAATLVIAVTWARFSPYDLAADLAAQEAAAKGQTPAPGAEAALRRLIAAPPPRRGMDVTKLGPLQSIGYLGSDSERPNSGPPSRIDNFRVTYHNGILVWRVGLDKKGAPEIATYDNLEPPTPAKTIIAFSSISTSRLWYLATVRLALMFALASIGHFVLRLRL